MMEQKHRRKSKYVASVEQALVARGHATNAQLAHDLRHTWPDLSDTTVHRITARMVADGIAQQAPNTDCGSMVFDANIQPHDHFRCSMCGGLRDVIIPKNCRWQLKRSLNDCNVTGSLTIVGECCECIQAKEVV